MNDIPILSIVILLPLAGALLLLAVPSHREEWIKRVALAVAGLGFVVSLPLVAYNQPKGRLGFVEKVDWVPDLGITWHLAIDGISLWLVLLTTFLGPIIVLGAWNAVSKQPKAFFFWLLALQTFMLGTFCARNLAVFYVFWELMLVPMFFLIGVWGGSERIYATVKFVLYTVAGSMMMLAAIFYLYWLHHEQFGRWSLEFAALYKVQMGLSVQGWMLLAFGLAFAIKVPIWPLHTWLPDAHVQAPTAGSVVLAGVLLKMGTYGFLRLGLPLCPGAVEQWGWIIMLLAVIGIIYGALVAMVQPDMKKLVAYSSVSHMGYIMLGIFVLNQQGASGGILQMLNHGISTGALFLLVGVLYERTHTRQIWDYGGLAKIMPVYAALFVLVALSSAGLPGTNGFVGEFLTLLGAFQWGHIAHEGGAHWFTSYGFVIFAATGLVLGAVYLLWMIERVFFGPVLQDRHRKLPDLSLRELTVFAPLVVMIFWLGLFPKPFIDKMQPTVDELLLDVERGADRTKELHTWLGSPSLPTIESALADAAEEVAR